MGTILLIILILLLIGGVPQTGWHQYGYGPSGIVGVVLVIIVVMILLGRL